MKRNMLLKLSRYKHQQSTDDWQNGGGTQIQYIKSIKVISKSRRSATLKAKSNMHSEVCNCN